MSLSRWMKDLGGLALYQVGPRVVPNLSRLQQLVVAEQLGDALWRASREDAALMEEELNATLGDEPFDQPASAIVREAFRLRMFNELEVLNYPRLNARTVQQMVFVENGEHLNTALARGRGAIIMIGHFGANQLIMPAFGHQHTMHQLSAPPTAWSDIRTDGRANARFARVQKLRWQLEQRLPAQHIDVFGFLRPAYRALARNELVGLAFDGGGGSRFVPMRVGRRLANISTQPWQLARTTGAAVVPAAVVRIQRQQLHRVYLGKPIFVPQTDDRDADLAAAVSSYSDWFTKWLRRRPEHYLPYLLLRRRVRSSDTRPFFDDYPGDRP
jgi:lauroyl/myristoyl acyltransferase